MQTTQDPQATDTTVPSAPTGLGAQITPWAVMGLLQLSAAATRIAVHAVGHEAEVAAGVGAAAFTIAVVAAYGSRRRMMSKHLRARYVAACYLGATWLTLVTAHGLTLTATAMLYIVGAGLSLLYWRKHRIGDTPEPILLIEPDVDEDLYIDRWNTYLGAAGKQLAGSKLTHPQIIKAGYRYTLNLVPGTHTVDQVAAMPGTLRSGLRLMPGQDVIVETHTGRPEPTAILTIVTKPQIAKPQKWPGPAAAFNRESGSVNLGPFVDGEGGARFGVYKQDGIFGGYIQGGNGSGKSRMIDSIAMSLAASTTHPTIIWYADGQTGSSSPLLSEHADWAALTPEAFRDMLTAAARVMQINGVENRLNKAVGFHPTTSRPGLFIIADECHAFFDPARNPKYAAECQALALLIAREGRKVGVALLMASQSATLDAFGGAGNGADTLRACLLQGNGIILRSKTKNAKLVFDVDINPSKFPKLPGYAYLCDPEEGARSAPFRSFWVTGDMAQNWPQRIRWGTLRQRQANAAGQHYGRRNEVAAEQAVNDARLLELADAGLLEDFETYFRQSAATPVAVTRDFGDLHRPVHRVAKFWVPEPVNGDGLKPGQQKVLDAIRRGHTSRKQIMAVTHYSETQVHNLIGQLTKLGRIAKPIIDGREAYGEYRAVA